MVGRETRNKIIFLGLIYSYLGIKITFFDNYIVGLEYILMFE
jgi:hypothetical protein